MPKSCEAELETLKYDARGSRRAEKCHQIVLFLLSSSYAEAVS